MRIHCHSWKERHWFRGWLHGSASPVSQATSAYRASPLAQLIRVARISESKTAKPGTKRSQKKPNCISEQGTGPRHLLFTSPRHCWRFKIFFKTCSRTRVRKIIAKIKILNSIWIKIYCLIYRTENQHMLNVNINNMSLAAWSRKWV